MMERDFDGTLAAVARIGYREVEFAGYFGRPPAQVSASLARLGLSSPSTHIPYSRLIGGWGRVLDESLVIGHRYVTIPWLPADERRTTDDWLRVADRFNVAGRAAREAGLGFAYHNHDFEFQPVGGKIPFDLLLEHTDPTVVSFEPDLYWMVRSGHDPLEYVREFGRRFPMYHVKDSGGPPEHEMVNVGAGVIDFETILRAAEAAGAYHYFVEHDEPADPRATIRAGHAALAALRH